MKDNLLTKWTSATDQLQAEISHLENNYGDNWEQANGDELKGLQVAISDLLSLEPYINKALKQAAQS